MYSNPRLHQLDRSARNRSDPTGYQERPVTGGRETEDEIRRILNRARSVTRTPTNDNGRARSAEPESRLPANSIGRARSAEPESRGHLYNSLTSSHHGMDHNYNARDPTPRSNQKPVRMSNDQRSRRVNFSRQLEIHEKQRMGPPTPTVPILRTRKQLRTPNSEPRKSSGISINYNARDPTPRSEQRPVRRKSRSKLTRKTIADILYEQAAQEATKPTFADPPLNPAKRLDFSAVATNFPTSGFNRDDAEKQGIDPEAVSTHPKKPTTSQSQTQSDMTELFPEKKTKSDLTEVHVSKTPAITKTPESKRKKQKSELDLSAFATRTDHWDALDLIPEVWQAFPRDQSPSNASSESQDALLINKKEEDSSCQSSGKKSSNKSVKHDKKRTRSSRYAILEEPLEENIGTEMVLVPQISIAPKGGACLSIGSDKSKSKNLGFRGLLKTRAGSSGAEIQKLPVVAMSFEDSIDLKKKNTDETSDASSVWENIKDPQWGSSSDRSSSGSYDNLSRRNACWSRKRIQFILVLVCFVFSCLGLSLSSYYFLIEGRSNEEPIRSFAMNECTNGEILDTFSERYKEIRKVVMNTSVGVASKVDTPGSPQRKALCWVADYDLLMVSVQGNNIFALLQRYTMGVIYFSLVSENGDEDSDRSLTNTDFLSPSHECEWGLVLCGTQKTVTALLMEDKMLRGPFPVEIANLGNLSFLELSLNDLTGTIPTLLSELSQLEYLNVAFNSFTGELPSEVGLMTKLEFLNMRSNQIQGNLPAELGQLSRLEMLLIEGNWFSGTLPAELGNLMEAQQMSFRKNYLTGEVPKELCELKEYNLSVLKVDSWIECDCCTT